MSVLRYSSVELSVMMVYRYSKRVFLGLLYMSVLRYISVELSVMMVCTKTNGLHESKRVF